MVQAVSIYLQKCCNDSASTCIRVNIYRFYNPHCKYCPNNAYANIALPIFIKKNNIVLAIN